MDVRLPELDGLEATRQITADPSLARTRVLVLTTFELDGHVFGALRAGASGLLLEGGELTDLLNAVRVVADGESLTAREREVLARDRVQLVVLAHQYGLVPANW
jgi:DNA-binding NarL/FixJ family response regulator